MIVLRQARLFLKENKFAEDDINEICPDSYLKRESRRMI